MDYFGRLIDTAVQSNIVRIFLTFYLPTDIVNEKGTRFKRKDTYCPVDSVPPFFLIKKVEPKNQADSKRSVTIADHSFYESALEHPVIRRAQGRRGRCVLLVVQIGARFFACLRQRS
jgi:hypothetical protein